jgi:predicted RNA-binding protein Jag
MNPEIQDTINTIVKTFCEPLNLKYELRVTKEGTQYRVNIVTPDKELFESQNYELLYILQYIARVGVHKKYPSDFTHFLFDINSKRYTREKVVKEMIPDIIIKEVLELGKTIILINLNGYERKLLHTHYFNMKGVSTKSLGDEESRKLMIMPTSEVGVSGIENAKVYDLNKLVVEYNKRRDEEENL